MSLRIYLISCSGRPNYGDELITAGWLAFFYKNYPQYEIWLDSPEPGNAQALFRQFHPHVKVINTLWKLCWRCQDNPEKNYDNISQVINNFGSPDIDLNISIFRSSDVVHILGGGYINAKWKENYCILFAASVLKNISDVKVFTTGLSLFPHEDFFERDIMLSCLNKFDHVSVRDDISAELFNIHNYNDDAYLGLQSGLYHVAQGAEFPDVLCCIQNELADYQMFSHFVDLTGDYLRKKQQQGKTLGYFEAIPGADSVAYHRLKEKVSDIKFYAFSELWTKGFPAKSDTEIISTRFHHHLVGASLGLKGSVLIIDSEYYENKHDSLLSLNTGWQVINHQNRDNEIYPSVNVEFKKIANNLSLDKLRLAQQLYFNE